MSKAWKQWERRVADDLRNAGVAGARRVPMSGAGTIKGDVLAPGFYIEAKKTQRAQPGKWLDIAVGECGGRLPVVAWNRDRPGVAVPPIAILLWDDFLVLAAQNPPQTDSRLADEIESLLRRYR